MMSNQITITTTSLHETIALGVRLGRLLRGGELLELVSDVGGGKTTFVRGLAEGIGSSDQVMSPTFTISRIYEADKLSIHHFDFYRLSEPGIIGAELSESLADPRAVVVIEWSDIVAGVLPSERLRIEIAAGADEEMRLFSLYPQGGRYEELARELA